MVKRTNGLRRDDGTIGGERWEADSQEGKRITIVAGQTTSQNHPTRAASHDSPSGIRFHDGVHGIGKRHFTLVKAPTDDASSST